MKNRIPLLEKLVRDKNERTKSKNKNLQDKDNELKDLQSKMNEEILINENNRVQKKCYSHKYQLQIVYHILTLF